MKAKYVVLVIVCLLFSQAGRAQTNDQLFEKYADMDNVTSVYISKAMFQMMPVAETAGLSLMNMKGKVESLQVLNTERMDLVPQMRNEFSKLIKNSHSELMRVRDGKTKATFYANMQGETVKDLLMLADTDSTFTVIQLVGNFTLQDIQEITQEFEK
ncbi:hypothetical protein M2137_002933 [Parabacteroides sp. PFB2-10]|uniref:DUF4252 domain-containing protein n=1 Tax=Parabacteroides sp. PFB2-10 TaxID=1742405 RepID=UPI0024757226|nr:DUF4252 domain-containing protein [Parabacteroides sp. PFB2-10]MDH6314139.1 hypothetical protein [Parabacteroides sp. PFB2-10]MDL2245531.1 DUF4252 domain-containing protein [Parabacteroides sp. OttesenSCG-928-J18]